MLQVANICGCSESFISKLENGHTSTSFNMLHRIATALDVNIVALLPCAVDVQPSIVRAGERVLLQEQSIRKGDGVELELISSHVTATIFQVNLHHIAPGGHSDGQIVHEGEEFIYVLKGAIELCLGNDLHILKRGDAAFFSSSEPHGYANCSPEKATILWVNTPPTY